MGKKIDEKVIKGVGIERGGLTRQQAGEKGLLSKDIVGEKLAELRRLFPEAFAEGALDLDTLGELVGQEGGRTLEEEEERFGLHWVGKGEALRVAQRQSAMCLRPEREKSVEFDKAENLFIEGDNLEVLKLLCEAYFGKVKMIYIDPPYNTGQDFIYPDNFSESKQTYLRLTGQVGEEGEKMTTNTESEGRYHSKWLSMMYPRLFLARNLLRDDGVIFISIDDNEVHHLRSLCNHVFGEENFIGSVSWEATKSITNTALISQSHQYQIIFAKNIDYFTKDRIKFRLPETGQGFKNPDNDPRGVWKADPFQVGGWRPNQQYKIVNPQTKEVFSPNEGCSWKNDDKKFQSLLKDGRIVFGVEGTSGPQRKRFLTEALGKGRVTNTVWDDVDTTSNATVEVKKLFDDKVIFNYPKPVSLIKKCLQLGAPKLIEDAIVLDFFAGSCTTAHAVMQLNEEDGGKRRYIMVQLPEPIPANSEAHKAGYKTIADIGRERIRRAAKKITQENPNKDLMKDTNLDFGFKSFRLDESNFKIWDGDVSDMSDEETVAHIQKQLDEHLEPILPDRKDEDILFEILLKSGYPLTSSITAETLQDCEYYRIAAPTDEEAEPRQMIVCLTKKVTKAFLDALEDEEKTASAIVMLCSAFNHDPSLLTNFSYRISSKSEREKRHIQFTTI